MASESLGCGADCNDGNADVRPAQAAWFTEPIAGVGPDRDFDYDCARAASSDEWDGDVHARAVPDPPD